MTDDREWVDDGVLVRRVVVGDLATNCWILASTENRHAVIVDPGAEPDRILRASDDLDVRHIVVTHTHWDHVLAVPEIVDELGVDVLAHRKEEPVWPDEVAHLAAHGHFDAGTATGCLLAAGCALAPPPATALWDGRLTSVEHADRVVLDGDLALDVLHTPGHTPGGLSLRVGGQVFTGDTLFPGGPGLTGWPHSDFATIIESIERSILHLPDNTTIHPGHGESTTVGRERPHLPTWIARGW